jgi:type II restriction enzyme
MRTAFDLHLLREYTSGAQRARVLSESWVHAQAYCPNCGRAHLERYESGRPVADFYCAGCHEEFELKSKKTAIRSRIVDGAFSKMIERLTSSTNPSLFLLRYDLVDLEISEFLVVPKHFFTPEVIEKRKALSATARRAGWVGCTILIDAVPQSGRIYIMKNRIAEPQARVLATWRKTLFLRDENDLKSRGWLLDMMVCIERLGGKEFSLSQMYAFESELRGKHPNNLHVRDKIRQQMQVLRDRKYIEFVGRGRYRLV